MYKFLLLLYIVLCVLGCKSKQTYASKSTRHTSYNTTAKEAKTIVNYAETYKGTPYKYGGTTKKGMDCSGLVMTSFKKYNVNLPRTTTELSKSGRWVDIKNTQVGDLVFFATKKNSRKINHVGIVTNVNAGHVEFIHASSSKGVMTSSIAERYWYFAFVQARRVL